MKKIVSKTKAQAKVPARDIDWEVIRPLYEDGTTTVTALADEYGMTRQRLTRHAVKLGWRLRQVYRSPQKKAADLVTSQLMPSRLASRLKRLIAREIDAIEGETLQDRPAVERERDARRLASLVRSLEKLNEIKARKAKQEGKADGERATAEDLSAELERRFARFHDAEDADRISDEPEPQRDAMAG